LNWGIARERLHMVRYAPMEGIDCRLARPADADDCANWLPAELRRRNV